MLFPAPPVRSRLPGTILFRYINAELFADEHLLFLEARNYIIPTGNLNPVNLPHR